MNWWSNKPLACLPPARLVYLHGSRVPVVMRARRWCSRVWCRKPLACLPNGGLVPVRRAPHRR